MELLTITFLVHIKNPEIVNILSFVRKGQFRPDAWRQLLYFVFLESTGFQRLKNLPTPN